MKPFFKLIIPITAFALFHSIGNTFGSSAAIAQEADGCFMVNASGQMVDLSNLCGGSAKKASTNPKVFQAKIKRRESGVPVIEVTFNAKHKFEMLLDTGASRTMITQNIADALGVVPVSTEKSIVASGDVVESSVGRVASIKVGNAIVNEPTVLIGAVPLLGQNFFGEYDVIIRKDVVEFHAR
jgi:aspartyl protease family protein